MTSYTAASIAADIITTQRFPASAPGTIQAALAEIADALLRAAGRSEYPCPQSKPLSSVESVQPATPDSADSPGTPSRPPTDAAP